MTPIELVEPGDLVLAADPVSGVWSYESVLDQWSHVDDGRLVTAVLVDGSEITATDDHLFWVDSDGAWVELDDVGPGDSLLTPDGVATVAHVVLWPQANQLVWELDTTGPDTFTVHAATNDVLVHNADGCKLSDDEIGHILDGDSDGGFHFRENGIDPPGGTSIVIKKRPPSNLGIKKGNPWEAEQPYKAKVEVNGQVKDSTFFPDSWTRDKVIKNIETAIDNKGPGVLSADGTAKVFTGIS